MMRILRWVALAFLLFIGITEVLPWIRTRVEGISQDKLVGRPDPTSSDASACVHLATQVNTLVGDEVFNAKPPPGDSTAWVNASDQIHRLISETEDACTCPGAGCASAREAMRELDSLVGDLDRMTAGEVRGALSLASRQERIDVLLDQARVEAR